MQYHFVIFFSKTLTAKKNFKENLLFLQDCTNGLDERSCSSHLEFFKKTQFHKLEGHDFEIWSNTPPMACAVRCKEADFTCRSFSHK